MSVAERPALIQDWPGKRVTVMGLGRFGGGVGVTRWLAAAGARVTVTDKEPAERLAGSLEQIADLDLALHLGGHDPRDFRDTDLVVVNPAVPETSEYLHIARQAGVPVTTEINLFVERCPARWVGITGSVGKSTVTAMIGHVLEEAVKEGAEVASASAAADGRRSEADDLKGTAQEQWHTTDDLKGGAQPGAKTKPIARRVWVGGNIGRSLLDGLPEITDDDIVVLELSSFQLQRTPTVRWSPHVAVITGVTPNHLDWHGSFEAYLSAKLNIVRHQDRTRDVIVTHDTPGLRGALMELLGNLTGLWRYRLDDDVPAAVCDDRLVRWEGLRLAIPGRHNRENAAAALTVAHVLGVPDQIAIGALGTFQALPHRLQKVAERDGVTYYDDSKSTTPEAALTALRAFEAPLVVILGGYDKGSDLRPVAQEAAWRTKFAACIGTTGRGLAEAVRDAGGQSAFCPDLAAAVAACRERAQPGDVVLLSPACASWDQFTDYRARGEAFARLALGTQAETRG
jgi:UDP-N-acetylmuramoylalanine--D-glutamate ligase